MDDSFRAYDFMKSRCPDIPIPIPAYDESVDYVAMVNEYRGMTHLEYFYMSKEKALAYMGRGAYLGTETRTRPDGTTVSVVVDEAVYELSDEKHAFFDSTLYERSFLVFQPNMTLIDKVYYSLFELTAAEMLTGKDLFEEYVKARLYEFEGHIWVPKGEETAWGNVIRNTEKGRAAERERRSKIRLADRQKTCNL